VEVVVTYCYSGTGFRDWVKPRTYAWWLNLGLLNDAMKCATGYTASNCKIVNRKGCGRKWSWPTILFRHFPGGAEGNPRVHAVLCVHDEVGGSCYDPRNFKTHFPVNRISYEPNSITNLKSHYNHEYRGKCKDISVPRQNNDPGKEASIFSVRLQDSTAHRLTFF
jgi:hypothetical protein